MDRLFKIATVYNNSDKTNNYFDKMLDCLEDKGFEIICVGDADEVEIAVRADMEY